MKYGASCEVPAGRPSHRRPQRIHQIPAQGSQTWPRRCGVATGGGPGVQPWRIFVVLDEGDTISEIHEWKDTHGSARRARWTPRPPKGTIIDGVMVDPMTGVNSALACGQNNQGFGEVSVSALGPAAGTRPPRTRGRCWTSRSASADAPGVELRQAAASTPTIPPPMSGSGRGARVTAESGARGRLCRSAGESASIRRCSCMTAPPESGKLVAVTTLRGATAADGHRVGFAWRPDGTRQAHAPVKLLGQSPPAPTTWSRSRSRSTPRRRHRPRHRPRHRRRKRRHPRARPRARRQRPSRPRRRPGGHRPARATTLARPASCRTPAPGRYRRSSRSVPASWRSAQP